MLGCLSSQVLFLDWFSEVLFFPFFFFFSFSPEWPFYTSQISSVTVILICAFTSSLSCLVLHEFLSFILLQLEWFLFCLELFHWLSDAFGSPSKLSCNYEDLSLPSFCGYFHVTPNKLIAELHHQHWSQTPLALGVWLALLNSMEREASTNHFSCFVCPL